MHAYFRQIPFLSTLKFIWMCYWNWNWCHKTNLACLYTRVAYSYFCYRNNDDIIWTSSYTETDSEIEGNRNKYSISIVYSFNSCNNVNVYFWWCICSYQEFTSLLANVKSSWSFTCISYQLYTMPPFQIYRKSLCN